ncbi:hypothetical protein NQ314_010875 [Rhamnusium bicolor]|uniref:Uncharacterized protein n=1 Tax=Rhamnusium bicolor TaxID=1586634 RepID=A0AAV8XNI1_9CUCU|nr:hypothetical protein NQ314_010875 [Rhamnusium bicolor]
MKKLLFIVLVLSAQGYRSNAEDIESYASIRDIVDEFIKSLKDQIPKTIPVPDQKVTVVENKLLSAYLNFFNNSLSGLDYLNVDVQYKGVLISIPTSFNLNVANLNLHLDHTSVLELLHHTSLTITSDGLTE